jgi:hydroxymethylglutaryl-CoA lyase
MNLPGSVEVVEVGPRDGLQSFPHEVDAARKVAMIARMLAAGVTQVEATSFAHPRIVPRLADAEAVMAAVPRPAGVTYRALVPNRKGADRALAAGVDVLVGLLSASETYSRKNQNMSTAEALGQMESVAEAARDAGAPWIAALAMTFFDPYKGDVPVDLVLGLVERVAPLGPRQLTVATTSGLSGPGRVAALCRRLRDEWPDLALGVHLHNTNGMGLACALAALDAGVSSLDASVCGIGGGVVMPPDTPDAGNIATEDLVAMLDDLRIHTGIDADEVVLAARDVSELLGIGWTGFVPRAGTPSEVVARHR